MPSTDFLRVEQRESGGADLLRWETLGADADRILKSRTSSAWNALTYLIPVLAAAGIVFALMGGTASWSSSLSQEAIGARLLSMAVVAAAVIVGYFLVLREWLVSSQRLGAYASAAIAEANESQAWVQQERQRRGIARTDLPASPVAGSPGGAVADEAVARY